ncbi:MAG: hypothetical protein H6712_18715 [Myxococcales bacterium]|nr:hypothetical protein [Myxococcales bacterium]MCB9715907.1 hypothetical protein [Myxococcales bacterium]
MVRDPSALHGARPRPAEDDPSETTGTERMLGEVGAPIGRAHRKQVHRDPWPDFAAFDPAPWPLPQRRRAAIQWAGRARNEHGSVQQFGQLTQVLASAQVELSLLGCLARMITDEVRHAELCARMALTLWPEGTAAEPQAFRWPRPRPPWADPPGAQQERDPEQRLAWAASAILTACCLGETLSRPMLDALVVVTTEPCAEAVCRQILRDEHLHATFGFEALGVLLPRLSAESRARLQTQLASDLAGFQRSVCGGIDIAEVAACSMVIERDEPNLGVLSDRQYAVIFYSCLETEIFPRLRELGLDPDAAWAARGRGKG